MAKMRTAVTLATLIMMGLPAQLRAAPASPMMSGLGRTNLAYLEPSRPGMAPFAFVRFCVANAADCKASDGQETVVLTKSERVRLRQINATVNRSIRPQYDNISADVWEADVARGDCEDYVLTKRRALLAAGIPAGALRIAVARTLHGEGHAILLVRTDRGDLVLDNRFDAIKRWNATDLRILKVQSGRNPRLWFDL